VGEPEIDIAVGDEVVHPHHGPGVVTATETRDLGQGPMAYVVVELADGMVVKVPADSLAEVGLREPVSEVRAEEVLAVLGGEPVDDPGYRVRRPRHQDLLASGRLIDCAEVVRDLTAVVRDHDRGGTYADHRMLDQAREQLAAELAVALGLTSEAAMAAIDEALGERR
jgi:CarD family transcriptional regulator